MRPNHGMTGIQLPLFYRREHFLQGYTFRPTRPVVNLCRMVCADQGVDMLSPEPSDLLQMALPSSVDASGIFDVGGIPHPQLGDIALTASRIALAQQALELPPVLYERLFHVEHPPIEQASSVDWPFVDEPVSTWVQDLYRKSACQIQHAGVAPRTQSCLQLLALALNRDAGDFA